MTSFALARALFLLVDTRWETEIAAALQSAQIKERFDKLGIRPGTLDGAGYTALIRAELPRWREVIKAGNIRAD
jgi:tripartite-type tricarboxylate transporter receptor subunit TctC